MEYSILVRDQTSYLNEKVVETSLTTVPNESVDRLLQRAGISGCTGGVVELRVQWSGRQVGPMPTPAKDRNEALEEAARKVESLWANKRENCNRYRQAKKSASVIRSLIESN